MSAVKASSSLAWLFTPLVTLFLCHITVLLTAGKVAAQGVYGDVTYARLQSFRIPFTIDPAERRIRQVQLYVSSDQGKTWYKHADAQPEQGSFNVNIQRDGNYWFAVRTIDQQGMAFPLTMEGAQPSLKMSLDTQPPAITLRALPPRDGQVGVEWDIRDDNLDPQRVRLDYHLPNTAEWLPLPITPAATGTHYWRAGVGGSIDVRMAAVDRAGNQGEAKTTVAPNGVGGFGTGSGTLLGSPPASATNVRWVNSRRISLNFKVDNQGPSGISAIELWYTQDGRSWQKYSENTTNAQPPYVLDVSGEGLYGLSLVVRSGVGLSERPPQVGDPPQLWIEVDETKPLVQLTDVDVGRGANAGNLTVTWAATDKNLGNNPITLSYAEKPDSTEWKPFAQNIANTGRNVWKMPSGVPYQFYVRVEAVDKAGNVATDQTAKTVIVDLAIPKVTNLEAAPVK